nr:PepSY domain-containing protein [Novosphingobium panipatense]
MSTLQPRPHPRKKRSRSLLPRPILVLHRWLGVFVGLLMTIWCLSGFVMIYVDYPRLEPAAQMQGLAALHVPPPSAFGAVDMAPDTPIASARVEMMAGRPVLRVVPGQSTDRAIPQIRTIPATFDLATGKPLAAPDPQDIGRIAQDFASGHGIAGDAAEPAATGIDQWTVQTYKRNAPLYRVDFAEGAGTEIYISGKSGEVVQETTRFQRFWGWLGAVPHWLYPTMLRQNGALWNEVVVWTSLAGCFLTVTGIWAGIARVRRKREGHIGSPYKGLWWWHHVFGLFFGLLTLTWVASGLFSMNPWGFLDSMAGLAERERLAGAMTWRDVRHALSAMHDIPDGALRIETAPLRGSTFLLVTKRSGSAQRFDAAGQASALTERELRGALGDGPVTSSLALLQDEDAYYYRHRFAAPLPVWRAVLADAETTRLYIDPTSGQILRAFDRNGRGFRWLQDGLHSLDFPVLRKRPWWDFVVLPLLAAVTLVCATGTWMAWNKLRRDLRRVWRRRIRRG